MKHNTPIFQSTDPSKPDHFAIRETSWIALSSKKVSASVKNHRVVHLTHKITITYIAIAQEDENSFVSGESMTRAWTDGPWRHRGFGMISFYIPDKLQRLKISESLKSENSTKSRFYKDDNDFRKTNVTSGGESWLETQSSSFREIRTLCKVLNTNQNCVNQAFVRQIRHATLNGKCIFCSVVSVVAPNPVLTCPKRAPFSIPKKTR